MAHQLAVENKPGFMKVPHHFTNIPLVGRGSVGRRAKNQLALVKPKSPDRPHDQFWLEPEVAIGNLSIHEEDTNNEEVVREEEPPRRKRGRPRGSRATGRRRGRPRKQ